MNRKISVFILLILLAASFKYRAKSVEANLSSAKEIAKKKSVSPVEANLRDFEAVVVSLQKANQEFASGDPAPFKTLWSRGNDVSFLGKTDNSETKGWKGVEARLNSDSQNMRIGNEYAFENISTQVGSDLACLLQNEHYRRPNGKAIDLRVTVVFRKEADGWKIVHRHAENLRK